MKIRVLKRLIVLCVLVVSYAFCNAAQNNGQLGFSKSVLEGSGKTGQIRTGVLKGKPIELLSRKYQENYGKSI